MVVVPVAAPPVTIPELLTVAIAAFALLQTPPVTRSVSVIVAPEQTLSTPAIKPASGSAFTVILCVAVSNPQADETI